MIVNSKIILAFAAGAMVATGVVYLTLRPPASARPHIAAVVPPAPAPKPVPPAAEPVSLPAPAVEPEKPKLPPAHPTADTRRAPKHPTQPAGPPVQVARATPPRDDVPASVRTDNSPPPAPPAQVAEPPASAPAAQPAPPPEPAPEPVSEAAPVPAPPPARRVTLDQGLLINIRLAEALSSDKNEKGDSFYATLDQPLVAGGFVIAERGARVEGLVVEAARGGRGDWGDSTPHLSLALTKVHTSDGQRVAIETTPFNKKGTSSTAENAAKIGGGAVLGAIIGAAAGGGKGAGIGAAAGGAAGAGAVALTHNRPVVLPTETRIGFRLQHAVTVTERKH